MYIILFGLIITIVILTLDHFKSKLIKDSYESIDKSLENVSSVYLKMANEALQIAATYQTPKTIKIIGSSNEQKQEVSLETGRIFKRTGKTSQKRIAPKRSRNKTIRKKPRIRSKQKF